MGGVTKTKLIQLSEMIYSKWAHRRFTWFTSRGPTTNSTSATYCTK